MVDESYVNTHSQMPSSLKKSGRSRSPEHMAHRQKLEFAEPIESNCISARQDMLVPPEQKKSSPPVKLQKENREKRFQTYVVE